MTAKINKKMREKGIRRWWRQFLFSGLMAAAAVVVTACGGEFEQDQAGRGDAVSGGSVSGEAVEAEKVKKEDGRSCYEYCSENCVYLDSDTLMECFDSTPSELQDAMVQFSPEGTPLNVYTYPDMYSIEAVGQDYLYLSVPELNEEEYIDEPSLYRVPIQKKERKEILQWDQMEKVISCQEYWELLAIVGDRYIIYDAEEEDALCWYDVESGEKKELLSPDPDYRIEYYDVTEASDGMTPKNSKIRFYQALYQDEENDRASMAECYWMDVEKGELFKMYSFSGLDDLYSIAFSAARAGEKYYYFLSEYEKDDSDHNYIYCFDPKTGKSELCFSGEEIRQSIEQNHLWDFEEKGKTYSFVGDVCHFGTRTYFEIRLEDQDSYSGNQYVVFYIDDNNPGELVYEKGLSEVIKDKDNGMEPVNEGFVLFEMEEEEGKREMYDLAAEKKRIITKEDPEWFHTAFTRHGFSAVDEDMIEEIAKMEKQQVGESGSRNEDG